MPVEAIRSPILDGIPHGFLGRAGGVSTGTYAGLNVGIGSDDDPAAIAENRRRAVEAVAPGAKLVTVYQIHSATAATVTAPFDDAARPKADALVTDRPGLALGILTADCVPILLADAQKGVIAAVHAGWKGALAGVIAETINQMARLGARTDRIAAAVGPCIGRAAYEVTDVFTTNFCPTFFTPGKPGHQFFDLESYVKTRLTESGIARIDTLGLDTLTDPDRFFSYRRATLAGEAGYGRQISLIALPS